MFHQAIDTYHYLNQSGTTKVEGINDEKEFTQMMDALTTLGLSVDEQVGLYRTVCSVAAS